MPEPTDTEKVTAIVQAILKGGWRPDSKDGLYEVNGFQNGQIVIIRTDDIPKSEWSVHYYYFYIEQLLLNSAAMKAVWGGGKVCPVCGRTVNTYCIYHPPLGGLQHHHYIFNFSYHSFEAHRIVFEKDMSAAIDYLWRNLPGEKSDGK